MAADSKKVKRIGLAFNQKKEASTNERLDKYAEFDDAATIGAIHKALESGGYDVVPLEANENFYEKAKSSWVDFVFNIAEGMRGESRESQIPAMLEMLGIPYSGSGVLCQAITLDKRRKKEILGFYNIPTPKFQLFTKKSDILSKELKFPMIVKPNSEGSSVGIMNDSLVKDEASLRKKVNQILDEYDEPALVEEYCEGREFTVALIGNEELKILPLVEINFDHMPNNMNKLDSYEAKWIYDTPDNPVDPLMCPAKVDDDLKNKIEKVAIDTFRTLDCVDLCRIDIRLDSKGVPNVLDVNCLPGLIPDPKSNSRFPRAAFVSGMTYNQLILEILDVAIKRNEKRIATKKYILPQG